MIRNVFRRRAGPARKAERGFSLLEVLITLMIVALVATLVGPRLMSALDRSKTNTAGLQAKSLKSALDVMRIDLGRYPTAEEGLASLVTAPAGASNWQGPYLDNAVPNDPWNRPYLYVPSENPDEAPRIGTYGADGKAGGTGSAKDVFSNDPAGAAAAATPPAP